MTWQQWYEVVPMNDLKPGNVKINRAEFLAALITCETFVKYCSNKYTTLAIDSFTAKRWFDSARCPIYPFDRCAQGVSLFMLKHAMKIRTTWIPSAENSMADICSRKTFPWGRRTHYVAGRRLKRVRPRWREINKFL